MRCFSFLFFIAEISRRENGKNEAVPRGCARVGRAFPGLLQIRLHVIAVSQPCARVTMEDPPSTGSSSSRILQVNFTVPLRDIAQKRFRAADRERRREIISAIATDRRISDALLCCFMSEAPISASPEQD
jgi:hypothetical protein